MSNFTDFTKQVHLINDLILSDMVYGKLSIAEHQWLHILLGIFLFSWLQLERGLLNSYDKPDESPEGSASFSQHLLATKNWFSRISWANKKRYVLALLQDVRSAWTLSLLLKSLWNCRPKDAVLSVCETPMWSSYDEVPIDHNRAALPTTTLAQVMRSDRMWFLTLESEPQAIVLSELLTVAGGPVMWAVLSRAQILYERYRTLQLQNLQECTVIQEPQVETSPSEKGGKKDTKTTAVLDTEAKQSTGKAQKELEANLAAWNATIKSMKDGLKLEEHELTFQDGTKRKIWKVNRPKPEVMETVDLLQLLPSSIGKRILSFLPRGQLGDYARTNKYWAFLVDEFRADLTARQKIDSDLEKLNEIMLRHDTSLELIEQIDLPGATPFSSIGNPSGVMSQRVKANPSTKAASEKSGGAYSFRHFLTEKLTKQQITVPKPLRNLAELTDRLDKRGAADENLWNWCENILNQDKVKGLKVSVQDQEGVLTLGNIHFPCPLMRQCLEVPLNPPLLQDPGITPAPQKARRNISNATVLNVPREQGIKRYSLWTKDFSGLYPAYKIESYHSSI